MANAEAQVNFQDRQTNGITQASPRRVHKWVYGGGQLSIGSQCPRGPPREMGSESQGWQRWERGRTFGGPRRRVPVGEAVAGGALHEVLGALRPRPAVGVELRATEKLQFFEFLAIMIGKIKSVWNN